MQNLLKYSDERPAISYILRIPDDIPCTHLAATSTILQRPEPQHHFIVYLSPPFLHHVERRDRGVVAKSKFALQLFDEQL